MEPVPTEKERFTVILEDLNSKFDLVVESVIGLREEFNQKFNFLREDLHEMKSDSKMTHLTVAAMVKTVSNHETRINKIEKKTFH